MSEINYSIKEMLENCTFICIGPNVWGKGDTPSKAIAQCRKAYGRPLREYDLHLVHKNTVVNEMGGFTWGYGEPSPQRIDSVRIKAKGAKR